MKSYLLLLPVTIGTICGYYLKCYCHCCSQGNYARAMCKDYCGAYSHEYGESIPLTTRQQTGPQPQLFSDS